jgi:hypothetical protein
MGTLGGKRYGKRRCPWCRSWCYVKADIIQEHSKLWGRRGRCIASGKVFASGLNLHQRVAVYVRGEPLRPDVA